MSEESQTEMRHLGNLSPASGSHTSKKRKGRGPGSGLGKTPGKGHKGQKARKGGSIAPGFEGGQTPIYRRLPKYGFSNARNRVEYQIVNVADLEAVFNDGDTISKDMLLSNGLVRNLKKPIKILARGELNKKLTISADKFSKSAKVAIEDKGGKIESNK